MDENLETFVRGYVEILKRHGESSPEAEAYLEDRSAALREAAGWVRQLRSTLADDRSWGILERLERGETGVGLIWWLVALGVWGWLSYRLAGDGEGTAGVVAALVGLWCVAGAVKEVRRLGWSR